MVPIYSKTGEAVPLAFRSILTRNGRRPLAVRTDKCKEFVNVKFRKLIDGEGTEMSVSRNPTVNCYIVKRFNRTMKSQLYTWLTRNNT